MLLRRILIRRTDALNTGDSGECAQLPIASAKVLAFFTHRSPNPSRPSSVWRHSDLARIWLIYGEHVAITGTDHIELMIHK
jgi:hypothetical protein